MEDAQKSFTYDPKYIRNFSIIAHIDHGKSTIADRLLEQTKTVSSRDMQAQLLDDMDLERERGITIKAHAVTMYYTAKDGHTYQINFIDTPGHVDFTYEVSRSLSACEGALLVVDASQGVQAQTLANVYLAIDRNLEIITVLNKIDLPAAEPERVKIEIEELIGIDTSHAVECSAKTGLGIDQLLESLIKHIPPPKPAEDDILRCLIFDSLYDQYKGVIVSIRVISGVLKKGVQIKMMVTEKVFEVNEVGIYAPNSKSVDALRPGEVGYFIATIKKPADVKIGDTVTTVKNPAPLPLPGFKEVNPVVFAGIYPVDTSDLEVLTDSLKKLQLNDSSLFVEQESNLALGFGFRCGFLGLLHLEIVLERLEREFNLDIVTTAPSVIYKFHMTNGDVLNIDNPSNYPNITHIKKIEEPIVLTTVLIPPDYLGGVMGLVNEKRGTLKATESAGASRIILKFHIPLAEIIVDFHDRLKSITSGYGSYEFHHDHYEEADVVKLEIRVNEELVDLLSIIVHASKAEARGRKICEKLKHEIPNQQFKVPIQAAIGSKIIARETISSIGKNVTAKCYGGDITRKRKLLEKQKKGKKKLKEYGKVQIPHETFMNVLKTE